MSRPRMTIAGLLGIIAGVGVATAALRAATDGWDSALLGVVLLALLAAILLATYRAGRRRAGLLGFALFGWVYLIAAQLATVEYRLPTTKLLNIAWGWRTPPAAQPPGPAPATWTSIYTPAPNGGVVDLTTWNSVAANTFTTIATTPGSPAGMSYAGWTLNPDATYFNFMRIGHSLWALILAAAGASVARLCWRPAPPSTGAAATDFEPASD